MGMIIILCPRTGKQVSTGVELDKAHFDRMRETRFTMSCWLCGQEHEWSKRWATFVEDFGGESDGHRHDCPEANAPESAKPREKANVETAFGLRTFRRTRH